MTAPVKVRARHGLLISASIAFVATVIASFFRVPYAPELTLVALIGLLVAGLLTRPRSSVEDLDAAAWVRSTSTKESDFSEAPSVPPPFDLDTSSATDGAGDD